MQTQCKRLDILVHSEISPLIPWVDDAFVSKHLIIMHNILHYPYSRDARGDTTAPRWYVNKHDMWTHLAEMEDDRVSVQIISWNNHINYQTENSQNVPTRSTRNSCVTPINVYCRPQDTRSVHNVFYVVVTGWTIIYPLPAFFEIILWLPHCQKKNWETWTQNSYGSTNTK